MKDQYTTRGGKCGSQIIHNSVIIYWLTDMITIRCAYSWEVHTGLLCGKRVFRPDLFSKSTALARVIHKLQRHPKNAEDSRWIQCAPIQFISANETWAISSPQCSSLRCYVALDPVPPLPKQPTTYSTSIKETWHGHKCDSLIKA